MFIKYSNTFILLSIIALCTNNKPLLSTSYKKESLHEIMNLNILKWLKLYARCIGNSTLSLYLNNSEGSRCTMYFNCLILSYLAAIWMGKSPKLLRLYKHLLSFL
mmetsp:Transcript_10706/g.9642  ORF Transcript_10706/g.9642 Transcript_10706/m.9642 type:complete len:105 (-) Transcript_10706:1559-1873(-)